MNQKKVENHIRRYSNEEWIAIGKKWIKNVSINFDLRLLFLSEKNLIAKLWKLQLNCRAYLKLIDSKYLLAYKPDKKTIYDWL